MSFIKYCVFISSIAKVMELLVHVGIIDEKYFILPNGEKNWAKCSTLSYFETFLQIGRL